MAERYDEGDPEPLDTFTNARANGQNAQVVVVVGSPLGPGVFSAASNPGVAGFDSFGIAYIFPVGFGNRPVTAGQAQVNLERPVGSLGLVIVSVLDFLSFSVHTPYSYRPTEIREAARHKHCMLVSARMELDFSRCDAEPGY